MAGGQEDLTKPWCSSCWLINVNVGALGGLPWLRRPSAVSALLSVLCSLAVSARSQLGEHSPSQDWGLRSNQACAQVSRFSQARSSALSNHLVLPKARSENTVDSGEECVIQRQAQSYLGEPLNTWRRNRHQPQSRAEQSPALLTFESYLHRRTSSV